jgi:hypothetical protein
MPVDMSRYPDNWTDISEYIRFDRADGRCECEGECGRGHVGRCEALHQEAHPQTGSNVILTTAHLGTDRPDGTPGDKHDKMDVRHENLKAMCQACHLSFDIEEHVRNAAITRRNKQIEAGQMELFIVEDTRERGNY